MLNKITLCLLISLVLASTALAQKVLTHQPITVTITQAEDERRWSNELMQLLSNQSPLVRKRAALAAGRSRVAAGRERHAQRRRSLNPRRARQTENRRRKRADQRSSKVR